MAQSFSSREFREALSGFATGVTIVTAVDVSGGPVGITASSFNSVSMEPPLILWSVSKTALSAPAFRQAKHFAVHVLASDQVELSNRFAKSGSDKFGGLAYTTDANAIPILPDACARFDCTTWAVHEGGDHWIVVGQVENIDRGVAEPLVFSGGSYATASPLSPPGNASQTSNGGGSPVDGLLFYNLSRAYHQMAERFHKAVRENGLMLSEWRVLASLYGGATHEFRELAARTFVDPEALKDLIAGMRDDGLCTTSGPSERMTVTGTDEGHRRVEHLFALSKQLEKEAIGDSKAAKRPELVAALQDIISNTN